MKKAISYIASLGLIGIVTVIKFGVPGLGADTPTLLYDLSIILIAVYFGTGPAMAALVVSAGLINYVFLKHAFYLNIDSESVLQTAIFIIDGAVMIWLIARLRASERRLAARGEHLKGANARLTTILDRALDDSWNRKRVKDPLDTER